MPNDVAGEAFDDVVETLKKTIDASETELASVTTAMRTHAMRNMDAEGRRQYFAAILSRLRGMTAPKPRNGTRNGR
jgi:phosphoglycolate phosphatase-like HAD superfamily hydrolase